jgi:hypothetical protein
LRPPERGQVVPEFALCATLICAALFVPWFEGLSASTLLTRRLIDAFRGLFLLIAVS